MHSKLFTEDKNGVPVHWELEAESVDALTLATGRLLGWLETNEFTAHTGFGTNNTAQARQAPSARSQGRQQPRSGVRQVQRQRATDVPQCDFCEGDVWDNRRTRTGQQPDFKCKDKEACGAGGWIQEDGSVRWKQ